MKQEKPSSNESWGNTVAVSGSLICDLRAALTERLLHPRMRFLSHGAPMLILASTLSLCSWLTQSHTLTHKSATHSFTNSSTASLCHTSAPSFIQLRMYLFTCGFPPFFSHWLTHSIPSISHHPPHSLTHYSHSTLTVRLSNPYTFVHSLINDLIPSTIQLLTNSHILWAFVPNLS